MKPPSIRSVLLVRCGIGAGVLLCFLSAAVYLLVRHSLYRELDKSISQTAAMLADQVEYEDDAISFEWKEGIGTSHALPADGLFQFWDDRSGFTTRSPGLRSRDLPRFSGLDGQPLLRNILLPDGSRGRAIGLRVYPFVLPEELALMKARGSFVDMKSMPHTLVVARSAEPLHHTLKSMEQILACGALLTLGLGFVMIDRAVRLSLRPIDDLAAQMNERTGHQLDAPLAVPRNLPSELSALAKNFDSLLARLAANRQRERDFIRHAAHELRTPVAGLRATTDLALSLPRDAAAYAAHLATCQKTAIDLGELVNRLSALSRIDQTAFPPVLEPVDTKATLLSCMERFAQLFKERGLEVSLDLSDEPLVASGDITLLRIIFDNLLENAVCYARPASEVRVHGAIVGGRVEIRISNLTVGPPGNPDRLFEPLFRKESSRNDAGTHLGIGLTLALSAATSMGASLSGRMITEERIEFVLSVPRANDPPPS